MFGFQCGYALFQTHNLAQSQRVLYNQLCGADSHPGVAVVVKHDAGNDTDRSALQLQQLARGFLDNVCLGLCQRRAECRLPAPAF